MKLTPWWQMLKIITDVTCIEKYQYPIEFTHLMLRDMKEDCVLLEQPRINMTVKAANF